MRMARRVGVVCFLMAMTAAAAQAQMHMNVRAMCGLRSRPVLTVW